MFITKRLAVELADAMDYVSTGSLERCGDRRRINQLQVKSIVDSRHTALHYWDRTYSG